MIRVKIKFSRPWTVGANFNLRYEVVTAVFRRGTKRSDRAEKGRGAYDPSGSVDVA